ncbi:MAG: hypothetical protein GY772_24575 [bacterium]|nr:hypothetical protein [bacterium]
MSEIDTFLPGPLHESVHYRTPSARFRPAKTGGAYPDLFHPRRRLRLEPLTQARAPGLDRVAPSAVGRQGLSPRIASRLIDLLCRFGLCETLICASWRVTPGTRAQ